MDKEHWLLGTIKESFVYLILIILILFINTQILYFAWIPSSSMESTISKNSLVLCNRLSSSHVEHGDIIVFNAPDEPETNYIKRVIGCPGDIVIVKNSQVYINGQLLKENYVTQKMNTKGDGVYTVPKDSYFVMGDNRNHSNDSRFWTNKYVSADQVVAKPFDWWLCICNILHKIRG